MVSVDRIKGLSSSLAVKAPVLAATTTPITLSGLQTIDGVSIPSGGRVLVKDQVDATQNGWYDASTSAWARSLDADKNNDFVNGTLCVVAGGTQGLKLWRLSCASTVNVGTTALTFVSSADFTEVSAFITTLFDDADAAAARATLGVTTVDAQTHASAPKTLPVDADEFPLADSAAAFGLKKLTWANLKATLLTYLSGAITALSNVAGLTVSGGPLSLTGPFGMGYGLGSGGAVAQTTSKTTAVTLNKPTGQITMMADALAAGASVNFTINTSLAVNGDTVTANPLWSFNSYTVQVVRVVTGVIVLRVTNFTAGSLSDALVISVNIHKGSAS